MRNRRMKVGVLFYGVGTVLTGILDIAWRAFDASHQPIKSLGNLPGQNILACIVGTWLVAAGLTIMWGSRVKFGALASGTAYLFFVALWLPRYYAGIHALGWRIAVLAGTSFGLGQQLMLVAPAAILYLCTTSRDSKLHERAGRATRWMLGLPPIVFGALHILGISVFAKIVPGWMHLGHFWAAVTGIAFISAGVAICSGIRDILAARLLALMLLLFEGLVEIPPIFVRSHDQPAWGAAVYNLTAIGACWIFAEFLASRGDSERVNPAGTFALSHSDRVVA